MKENPYRRLPPIERKSDGSLYRMTPAQRKQANSLIRRECCCYEDGNCMLLDDGDTHTCPQTNEQALHTAISVTSPICSLYKSNFGTLRKWSAILLTLTKSTILPSLAIWCATPDSCRSLSGLVLPVAAARVVLPAALQGLDRQQMTASPPELLWERGGVALRERTRDTKS